MKRMLTAAVAMTLTLSLGASALAYSGTITLNGTKLDTSKLPDAPAGSAIPLRTVAEADYGFADWYADENRSFFSLDGNSIYVDCATGAIEVNGETLSNMKATSAQVKGSDVTITTPNGDELVSLARSIIDKVEMGASIKLDAAGMEESYNIPADCFTEAIGFFPMIVSADTIVIGKVADGKMDDAKAALEAQRALTQQNFEQYLPEPLERAKNGQIVTSGDYIMLIISGDNDTAIQMFKDGVK